MSFITSEITPITMVNFFGNDWDFLFYDYRVWYFNWVGFRHMNRVRFGDRYFHRYWYWNLDRDLNMYRIWLGNRYRVWFFDYHWVWLWHWNRVRPVNGNFNWHLHRVWNVFDDRIRHWVGYWIWHFFGKGDGFDVLVVMTKVQSMTSKKFYTTVTITTVIKTTVTTYFFVTT